MSALRRWWEVARREFLVGLRRPSNYVLLFLLGWMALGFSEGVVSVQSGEAAAGGTRSFVTSVFAQAMIQPIMFLGFGGWFLSIGAGLVVIRDLELQVVEVLHSTRLTAREYVWAKFAGQITFFLLIWCLFLAASMGFNHILAAGPDAEHVGPFAVWNYLFPTLLFGLPQAFFFAGGAFLLGAWTRRPIMVFAFTVIVMMLTLTFLTAWSPGWLAPEWNRFLMLIDPSGFRWLNETFLKVDRGVDFYNSAPLVPDLGFLLSRAAMAGLGVAAVFGASISFAARMRRGASESRLVEWMRARQARALAAQVQPGSVSAPGADAGPPGDPDAGPARPDAAPAARPPTAAPPVAAPTPVPAYSAARATLADLGMTSRSLGFWQAARVIGREEVRELLRRPGLYLFAPLIIYVAISNTLLAIGPFSSRILLTSGEVAVRQLNSLGLMLCLLLLFYTVESLHKERGRRLAEIYHSTPIGTGSMLFGKALGNSVVAAFILGLSVLTSAVMILIRQATGSPVGLDIVPFAAAYGAVLIPTFFFWTALVTALFALFRNRYAVYGIGAALVIYTAFRMSFGDPLPWTLNWIAWGAIPNWSDMGAFSLYGYPLLMNRLLALSLVAPLVAVSITWFDRRSFDSVGLMNRIRPKPVLIGALRLLPFAAPAIVLGLTLHFQGRAGFGGPGAEEAAKDYWRRNTATWTDFEMPSVSHVELDVDFEPGERRAAVQGAYTFRNHRDHAYEQLPITPGRWDPIRWTLNGDSIEPDNRAGLRVFTLPGEGLAPGESVTVGFQHEASLPSGVGRFAGGAGQFITDAGIVVGAFTPTLVPVPGYISDIGVDEDNSSDAEEYADDFYEGETDPLFGWGGEPFTVRTRITTPHDWIANGVGRKASDEVRDGRRTVVWETDHPVRFFNIIAGRFAVKEGDGTALYHHPGHDYNIEEMSAALDASLKYYSEWFHPFPWDLLKISQFPAFATYAQGFPTNITFSESIGFLADSDPRSHIAFMVVAHEAAHQWWGNLLTPGQGPGGNVLSEGMAHYSTALLHEQVYGDRYRIEFMKRLEEQYGDGRFVDSERPLVQMDGSRPGDGVVTYDKGGWVMWMLHQHMGRENALAGFRALIAKYLTATDFPVLQDMLAVMRPFAPDSAAFDAFAEQWFFDVVAPEYEFSDVTVEAVGGGVAARAAQGEGLGSGQAAEGDGSGDGMRGQGDGSGDELHGQGGVAAPGEWIVRGTLTNVGTGRMRVQVAATASERWSDEGDDGSRTVVAEGYRDARAEVVLGAGESAEFSIRADFAPERVVIDPDVMVLQLNREFAVVELEDVPSS